VIISIIAWALFCEL